MILIKNSVGGLELKSISLEGKVVETYLIHVNDADKNSCSGFLALIPGFGLKCVNYDTHDSTESYNLSF